MLDVIRLKEFRLISEFKELYLPIIMAAFLGYIAFQQMRINKAKLKLDLYNKRFEIYSITLKFHQELMSEGLAKETHREFIEAKQSSQFLFHPKDGIYDSLDEIHNRAFKVKACKENKETDNAELTHRLYEDSQEALTWIINEVSVLDRKISKYLNFHK